MIDLRRLRNESDVVRSALARRNKPELLEQLDRISALDESLREMATKRDALRARINDLSKKVGQAKRDKDEAAAEDLQAESRELGEQE